MSIEDYFVKPCKRKTEDAGNQPVLRSGKELLKKQIKLDLANDQENISAMFAKLPPNIPDIKWKEIKAENLHLSYGLMFSLHIADKVFEKLENEIVYDTNSKVQVYGKWHQLPRKQASYGDPGLTYTFSGTTVKAKEWTPLLRQLRDAVSSITGDTFNFVLVNRYKDGRDHIGEHKDDEKDLVRKSPIASLSFGEARDFVFRHQEARGSKALRTIEPVKLVLQHGSVLIMRYPTNSYWYHSLPVRKKCLGPRVNLTFRYMH